MREVTVRPATPDDADAVVPLMYESSKGLLEYSFRVRGEAPESFLRYAFLRGGGIFGYDKQLVGVTASGDIVATLTVYEGRQFRRLSFETTVSIFRHFDLLSALTVGLRSFAMARLFLQPRPDALFIANGCVAPPFRSSGIFTQILDSVFSSGRARGFAAVELDVSFANVRAQGLYDRLGFEITGERPYRGRRALDGFRRMTKTL